MDIPHTLFNLTECSVNIDWLEMAGGAKYSTSLLIFLPTCSVDFWDTVWKYTEKFTCFPLLCCCHAVNHIFLGSVLLSPW